MIVYALAGIGGVATAYLLRVHTQVGDHRLLDNTCAIDGQGFSGVGRLLQDRAGRDAADNKTSQDIFYHVVGLMVMDQMYWEGRGIIYGKPYLIFRFKKLWEHLVL
jgi:hypothetical protein